MHFSITVMPIPTNNHVFEYKSQTVEQQVIIHKGLTATHPVTLLLPTMQNANRKGAHTLLSNPPPLLLGSQSPGDLQTSHTEV